MPVYSYIIISQIENVIRTFVSLSPQKETTLSWGRARKTHTERVKANKIAILLQRLTISLLWACHNTLTHMWWLTCMWSAISTVSWASISLASIPGRKERGHLSIDHCGQVNGDSWVSVIHNLSAPHPYHRRGGVVHHSITLMSSSAYQ